MGAWGLRKSSWGLRMEPRLQPISTPSDSPASPLKPSGLSPLFLATRAATRVSPSYSRY